jgi:hypothetical protein
MNASVMKRPGWFRAVAVLALLWNLFGLVLFYLQYTMTPEQLAQLPEAQRSLQEGFPDWLWALYAVAVLAGTLGSILLLMGKRLALPVLWVSLLAVLVQFGYSLFPGRMIEVLGVAQAVSMPILVTLVAALLVWLARRGVARGWLT